MEWVEYLFGRLVILGIPILFLTVLFVTVVHAAKEFIKLNILAKGSQWHTIKKDSDVNQNTPDPSHINKVEFCTADPDQLFKYLNHILPRIFHPKKSIKIIQCKQTNEIEISPNYIKGCGKIDDNYFTTTKQVFDSKNKNIAIYQRFLLIFTERPTIRDRYNGSPDRERGITVAFESKSRKMIAEKVRDIVSTLPFNREPNTPYDATWQSFLEYKDHIENQIVPNLIKLDAGNISIGFRVECYYFYRNKATQGNLISVSFCPIRS